MNTNCKHCGADYLLHHYETNQCPKGGREAPIGQKQVWMKTTFEPQEDNSEIQQLRGRVADLEKEVKTLRRMILNRTQEQI